MYTLTLWLTKKTSALYHTNPSLLMSHAGGLRIATRGRFLGLEVLRLDQPAWLLCLSDSFASAWCLIWMQIYNSGHLWKLKQKLSPRHIEPPTGMKDATRKLLSSADNLFIYQQGFWQPSFCRKHNLWSLFFFLEKMDGAFLYCLPGEKGELIES